MKKFIAYFDILGYRERIKSKSLDEEYKIQEKFIKDTKEIIVDKPSGGAHFQEIHFSDTHIFYTNESSEDAFEMIIKSSLVFMSIAAVRTPPYFPLRGAVEYGDFLADDGNKIFIGDGLRKAYDLSEKQNWMGCCLSDSCYEQVKNFRIFEEFLKQQVLIEYLVPFKGEAKDKYVINMEAFLRVFGKESKDMPLCDPEFIKNIFINKGENDSGIIELDESAREKLKNTQKFFKYVKDNFKHNTV